MTSTRRDLTDAERRVGCPFCEQLAGRTCVTRTDYVAATFVHSARIKAYDRLPRTTTFTDAPEPNLDLRPQQTGRPSLQLDALALEERARRFEPPGNTPITDPRSIETLRAGMYAATMLDALVELGALERLPDGGVRRGPCACQTPQPSSPTHA